MNVPTGPTASSLHMTRRALPFVLLALVGCGEGVSNTPTLPKRPLFEVKGKVLLADGKPLDKARVNFVPIYALEQKDGKPVYDYANGGQPAVGDTGPDGSFTLRTEQQKAEGAAPGEYRVEIEMIIDPKDPKPPVVPFPKIYGGGKTPLKITLKPQATTLEPFTLKE